ncbi:MAG: hypothetical protein P8Y18_03690 [Candidatus Bathyarchaeota archaeon]
MVGIKIIMGISGKIRESIKNYDDVFLSFINPPTVGDHFGLKIIGVD